MQNNIIAVQEKEIEAAWFIKRNHCRIICVYRWYTHRVIGNPLVTVQGQMFIVPMFPLPILCLWWWGGQLDSCIFVCVT